MKEYRITVRDMKKKMRETEFGRNWTSRGTMSFFSSILEEAYYFSEVDVYIFISSEAPPDMPEERKYTIREYNQHTGHVINCSDYREYMTAALARCSLRQMYKAGFFT